MSENQENQAETIFLRAQELEDPGQLDAFLNGACGDDEALRKLVESLLRADAKAASFFDPRIREEEIDTAVNEPTERPGTMIGRYKLLEQIGEGGMGVVYMAEQTEPFIKKIALKIIKLGMDTKQVIARFEAERQALALMDHPNIAKVIDGGATNEGRPYFVMELVRGIPITEFCDKQKLSTRERLELFIPVCQAIQHAHQKGIIHRDIKPNNVLVTLNDGVPHPMVIDFGIAKATHQKLTEKTLFTHFAQMIGTPAYMSPEQAEMSRLDVDTRSDIYSLGVLLYELLIGTTPFPEKTLRKASWAEMQRILAEEEPQKPSVRLNTLTDQERTSLHKGHREDAGRIRLLVRRELDWIVMKCLEKDRNRRYATANGLAMDIRRYLDGDAPEAAPPTVRYQLGKMARRHKKFLAVAALLMFVLVAASVYSTRHSIRATKAERIARSEKEKADAINDFYREYFLSPADPWTDEREPSDVLSLVEVLSRTSRDLDGIFTEQPELEASIRLSLGRALESQGRPNLAIQNLERAGFLYQQEFGESDLRTLECQIQLGATLSRNGADAEKVERLLKSGYERLLTKHGYENELTFRAQAHLGSHYADRWELGQAETLDLPAGIVGATAMLGPDHQSVTILKLALAELRIRQRRHADAREIYDDLLIREQDRREKRGDAVPANIREANLLRRVAFYQSWWDGNHAAATDSLIEALRISQNQVGDGFPTLSILEELALGSLGQRDYLNASKWSEQAFDLAAQRWRRSGQTVVSQRVAEDALLWSFIPMITGEWGEALRRLEEIRHKGTMVSELRLREILVRSIVEPNPNLTHLHSELFRNSESSGWPIGRFDDALVLSALPFPPGHQVEISNVVAAASERFDGGYETVRAYLLDGLWSFQRGKHARAIELLEIAENGTETPEFSCIALYVQAMAKHAMGEVDDAMVALKRAELLFGKLIAPGRMAYPRDQVLEIRLNRFEYYLVVCEAVRVQAQKRFLNLEIEVPTSPEKLAQNRARWEPAGALIDRYEAHHRLGENSAEYETLTQLLQLKIYDFVSARVYDPYGPRLFANHAMRTLAHEGDLAVFSIFASTYLQNLDPRLRSFHSGWVRHFSDLPIDIQQKIIAATPVWAIEGTEPKDWGRFDLAWAYYAQTKFVEAYEVIRPTLEAGEEGVSTWSRILAIKIAAHLGRFDDVPEHTRRVEAVIAKYRAWGTGTPSPGINTNEMSEALREALEEVRRVQSGQIPRPGSVRDPF